MRRYIYTLFLFLFVSTGIIAQREMTWWGFGYNNGLNFEKVINGNAVLGKPDWTAMPVNTSGGTFCISDADGNFLLASDGENAYSSDGNVIENGNMLLGERNSLQSGIIVPMPRSDRYYYLFTTAGKQKAEYPAGIRYSIVDMEEKKILSDKKNVRVNNHSNIPILNTSGNISVISHKNGIDYWIVNRSLNYFQIWLLTAEGISSEPKIYDLGYNPQWNGDADGSGFIGTSKFSPDGRWIVNFSNSVTEDQKTTVFCIAGFDRETGEVSNPQWVTLFDNDATLLHYGEFSSNGKYLYIPVSAPGQIFQGIHRLTMSEYPDFQTKTRIYSDYALNALQIGPDRKIYGSTAAANQPHRSLFVINNPDEGGNYISHYTNFFPASVGSDVVAGAALPNFVASFSGLMPLQGPSEICPVTDANYSVQISQATTAANKLSHVIWNFGDGTPEITDDDFSTLEHLQTHSYATPGTYTITVTPYLASTGLPDNDLIQEFNVIVRQCVLQVNPHIRSGF